MSVKKGVKVCVVFVWCLCGVCEVQCLCGICVVFVRCLGGV